MNNNNDKLFIRTAPQFITCYGSGKNAGPALVPPGSTRCSGTGEDVTIEINKFSNGLENDLQLRRVTIKGGDAEKIGGWLKDAKNEDGKLDPEDLEKLPIVLK